MMTMTDIQTQFQEKIQELRDLNQQLLKEHPELKNNYWFERLWNHLNCQPLMHEIWTTDFKLGVSDLQEIDQAAQFLNVDYDLDASYQRAFPMSDLYLFVTFNLKHSYDPVKAKQQQMMFKSVDNGHLIHIKASSMMILLFDVFAFFALIIGSSNLIPMWIGFIPIMIAIFGTLLSDHQLKNIYRKIERR